MAASVAIIKATTAAIFVIVHDAIYIWEFLQTRRTIMFSVIFIINCNYVN